MGNGTLPPREHLIAEEAHVPFSRGARDKLLSKELLGSPIFLVEVWPI